MMSDKAIDVSPRTWQRLLALKQDDDESLDDVIGRLLDGDEEAAGLDFDIKTRSDTGSDSDSDTE